MAMGRLVESLETRQEEERRRFAKRFERFAARKNHALFKSLFKSSRGRAGGAPAAASKGDSASEAAAKSSDLAVTPFNRHRDQP